MKAAVSFALNRQVDVTDLSKPIEEENVKVSRRQMQWRSPLHLLACSSYGWHC